MADTAQASAPSDALAGPAAGAGAGALDLHEGISPRALCEGARPDDEIPDPAAGGCRRWPESLRLLSSHGELVRGRCRATNLCDYCARLAAVENSELLALDAMHGIAPELLAILTTRSTSIDPADFYDARRYLLRAVRKRWPEAQMAAMVEFTTGTAARSGGGRRPHWNLLIKGVPVDDVDELRDVVVGSWCRNVDAAPPGQYVGVIREHGGLLRYIAHHFQKRSQDPPAGWRGHRFLHSRGYLWTDTPAARRLAREELARKRAIARARAAGMDAYDAELAAHQAQELAAATDWRLFSLSGAALAPGQGGHGCLSDDLSARAERPRVIGPADVSPSSLRALERAARSPAEPNLTVAPAPTAAPRGQGTGAASAAPPSMPAPLKRSGVAADHVGATWPPVCARPAAATTCSAALGPAPRPGGHDTSTGATAGPPINHSEVPPWPAAPAAPAVRPTTPRFARAPATSMASPAPGDSTARASRWTRRAPPDR